MKSSFLSLTRLSILVVVLLLGFSSMSAQANLLVNPGFEAPFTVVGGNELINVAQGWTPWHVPRQAGQSESQNLQPEYYASSDTENGLGEPRIRGGQDAQQFSTLFGTFQGGVFQRVTGVQPNTELRFRLFAYVWSSSFDEADSSEDDGGVQVQIGIDPNGGEDGNSASIVWSSPVFVYDTFTEYGVTARAAGSAVSVWVRATVSFPVKHNVVYIDDASLAAANAPTSTPLPPTATALPPTNTPVPAQPTNTPVAVVLPSNTPIVAPTFTPAPAQPTNTPAPAQPTNTPAPAQPTNTPAPAQPTNTPAPAQPTNTPAPAQPTNTPAPAQPTNTLAVQPTNTPAPVSGDFPSRIVHTVRAGDTVGRLATLYGSSIEAIIAANGLDEEALIFVGQNLVVPVRLAPPATVTPTATQAVVIVTATPGAGDPPPATGTTTYVVQPGDTLRRIAQRFNTTVATLAQLNGIANVNLIFSGQRLTVPAAGQVVTPVPPTGVPATSAPAATAVPAPRTYQVQPGDNLFRIALRFGVSVRALSRANNITNPNFIFSGQVLTIP
jgi:LysM repeat protein